MKRPTVLIILDGFGYSSKTTYNAIHHAKTPNLNHWLQTYPHTIIQAAGQAVGLLPGTIGNSEVGHLTIGSGRIIDQDAIRIHNAIDDDSFFAHEILTKDLSILTKTTKALHIMGLLSDASVHSHEKHLYAYLQAAKQQNVSRVYIHAFLDGRDVPPQSAAIYLQRLEDECKKIGIGTLASITGRFYAMDRDTNWGRTHEAYNVLVGEQEVSFEHWQDALDFYYQQDITDEFIPPTQIHSDGVIKNGNGIVFINFRPDRARQLTESFVNPTFNHFPIKKLKLAFFISPVNYNDFITTDVLFEPQVINNTLKEVLAHAGKTTFAIAETEKYAHVTYFFNGGKEKPVNYETRILIPSIPAKNYIDYPGMSAQGITNAVLESLRTNPQDFYLINYANADMVGHSGDLEATIKSVECLDQELKKLYNEVVQKMNGTMYITADHGNAEDMFDENVKQPKTAHSNNPVYFIMLQKGLENKTIDLPLKGLSDIAPFILQNMNIELPNEMKKREKI